MSGLYRIIQYFSINCLFDSIFCFTFVLYLEEHKKMTPPNHLNLSALYASRQVQSQLIKGEWVGLYYIFDEAGKLLYVGQADFIPGRISIHKRRMPVATIAVLYCPRKLRDACEKEAIIHFKPPYNKMYNPDWIDANPRNRKKVNQ